MRKFESPSHPAAKKKAEEARAAAEAKAEGQAEPEIEGSELWQLLTKIPRPIKRVPFPRRIPGSVEGVGEVPVWPLMLGEMQQAAAAAEAHVKALFKNPAKADEAAVGYHSAYGNELAVQQIWRAYRDPNDLDKPAFPGPKAIRMFLTSDEIGVLYNHYLTAQAELGPITSVMDDVQYEELVRRLAEGGGTDPFDSLSWDLQRSLVVSMASQLVSFWTDTSSAGSPPDESTSLSSSESSDDAAKKSDDERDSADEEPPES